MLNDRQQTENPISVAYSVSQQLLFAAAKVSIGTRCYYSLENPHANKDITVVPNHLLGTLQWHVILKYFLSLFCITSNNQGMVPIRKIFVIRSSNTKSP